MRATLLAASLLGGAQVGATPRDLKSVFDSYLRGEHGADGEGSLEDMAAAASAVSLGDVLDGAETAGDYAAERILPLASQVLQDTIHDVVSLAAARVAPSGEKETSAANSEGGGRRCAQCLARLVPRPVGTKGTERAEVAEGGEGGGGGEEVVGGMDGGEGGAEEAMGEEREGGGGEQPDAIQLGRAGEGCECAHAAVGRRLDAQLSVMHTVVHPALLLTTRRRQIALEELPAVREICSAEALRREGGCQRRRRFQHHFHLLDDVSLQTLEDNLLSSA